MRVASKFETPPEIVAHLYLSHGCWPCGRSAVSNQRNLHIGVEAMLRGPAGGVL